MELAVGTAPWLVLCGFLEGLATGPELPVAVQAAIGSASPRCSGGSSAGVGRAHSTARDFARR